MGDYNTEHTAVKDLRVVLPATVRFDANGGSGTMDDVTVAMGDDYTLPANGFTAPDGKVFDKWRIGDTTYEPGATVTVNGDVTVTALWVDAPVTYTVTFRDNDGATVLSGPRAYPKDTPAANVTVPAVPNKTEGGYQYKFKEWDHPIAAVTADATYTATYTKGYTVTLTPGAGSGTDVTVQPIWEDDNTYTLPSKPGGFTAPAGKIFDQWQVGSTKYDPGDQITVTDNVTATALWKEPAGTDTYPIGMTWSPTAGGSPTAPGAAAANTEITVNPNTKAGYTLVSITVKDSDGTEVPVNGTTFTMPAKGVTVTVTYRAKSTGGSKTTDLVTSPVTTGVAEKLNTTDHLRYLAGYPERDIRPNGNVTRAETAQIFYRLLLWPDVTVTKTFSDVPDGAWYAKGVRTLASMGIINGYADGTFKPDAPITRAEFTAIATRFAKATGGSARFTDVSASHWAKGNIATASDYGWINGYADGTFKPENTITRAETATIVNHMLGRAADSAWVSAHRSELNQFTDLQTPSMWYYLDMVEASNSHDYAKSNGVETWSRFIKDVIE